MRTVTNLISTITLPSPKLTDWERSFLRILKRQIEIGRPIKAEQAGRLEGVWRRVT